MLIRVFCVVSMLNKLPPGVCWRGGGGGGGGATGLLNKGGGSNRLPALVTKQQAVEFPQVQTSIYNYAPPLKILSVHCIQTFSGWLREKLKVYIVDFRF